MSTVTGSWYNFILAQMASESYLQGLQLEDNAVLRQRLENGANHFDFIDDLSPDEIGATRMTKLTGHGPVATVPELTI